MGPQPYGHGYLVDLEVTVRDGGSGVNGATTIRSWIPGLCVFMGKTFQWGHNHTVMDTGQFQWEPQPYGQRVGLLVSMGPQPYGFNGATTIRSWIQYFCDS